MRPVWLIQRTDAVGGTRAIIEELNRRLSAEGISAEAVYLRSQPDSIRVRGRALQSLWSDVRDGVSLLRKLINSRPGVLVTFTPLLGSTLAMVARLLLRTRVLATHHLPLSRSSRLTKILDRIAGSTGVFERIIACAPFIAGELRDYPSSYTDRLRVIANGVPVPLMSGKPPKPEGIGIELPEGARLALTVGRLHRQKNLQLAVAALAQTSGWHLLILGEGAERPKLNKLAESLGVADRLHLPGARPKAYVQAAMRSADAFVLPSRTEGLSLALLEAMSYGLPCLVSDIPQNRYPLEAGGGEPAGFILPLENADAWVQTLRSISADPGEADRRGKRAREVQQAHFSEDLMYDQYLNEIRDLLQ